MGYLYLITSVLCGNIKGFCGKKTSSLTNTTADAVFFNFFRMLLCVGVGACMVFFQNGLSGIVPDTKTLLITLGAGITNSIFVVSWLFAVKYGMYMTVDVSLTMGTIIPILLSAIMFDEHVTPAQWIGLAILVVAVYIMCSYNNRQKGKGSIKTYLILFVCGCANGLTDFSQKLYVGIAENGNIAVYNMYIYAFSAVVLGVLSLFMRKEIKKDNVKKAVVYVVIMAVCLFAYSYFKTKAAIYLPSVQLYPISQSLSLIISAFMASVFFNEKITLSCVLGIVLSFSALLLINM